MPAASHSMPWIVFADGACSGNPGPGGWGAIVVSPAGEVREIGGGDRNTTNNRMELQAAIAALRLLEREPGEVALHTDSTYVIQGITQWIWAWRSRDWKTADGKDVSNAPQWRELFALVAKRGKPNKIDWRYVRGHAGVPGNERVDAIAVAFAQARRIELYAGPLLRYDVAILDIPEDTGLPARTREPRTEKTAAYSYLSLVNGRLRRHATWRECEAEVKGRPGAKFKKAATPGAEGEIVREWGLPAEALDAVRAGETWP
jgi:ribonuclease HI